MSDRLLREVAPRERLEQVAAILACGVRRFLRSSRAGARHVPHRDYGATALTVPRGPGKPSEFSPEGLEFLESPRLTVSRSR